MNKLSPAMPMIPMMIPMPGAVPMMFPPNNVLEKDQMESPKRKRGRQSKKEKEQQEINELKSEMAKPIWASGMQVPMFPGIPKLAAMPGLSGAAAMNSSAAMPR